MSVVAASFTEDHVVRLTGLTKGQLRAWDRRGFFAPHHAYEDRKVPYSRIHSFRDVVGLKAISTLLKKHRVSLPQLIVVANELSRRGFEHWADVTLYVIKGDVSFRERSGDKVEIIKSGQFAMLPVIDVISNVTEAAENIMQRSDEGIGKIVQNKHIMRNAPVIAGTRIPVATIQRYTKAGFSNAQIISEYPSITETDIKAAISFNQGLAKSA